MAITLVEVPKYRCERCGYEWFPKDLKNIGEPPIQCANGGCHSPYWNRGRVYKKSLLKNLEKKRGTTVEKSK